MPRRERPPFFYFYPDIFSSDGKVEVMTTEQVGAYMLLLCKAWYEEPPASIPNHDPILARWARLDAERWLEIKSAILAAFRLGRDGRWHQKRLRAEFDKYAESSSKKSTAASIAANRRWEIERQSRDAERIAGALPSQSHQKSEVGLGFELSSDGIGVQGKGNRSQQKAAQVLEIMRSRRKLK